MIRELKRVQAQYISGGKCRCGKPRAFVACLTYDVLSAPHGKTRVVNSMRSMCGECAVRYAVRHGLVLPPGDT